MKKFIVAAAAVVAGLIVFTSTAPQGHGNPNGAPAGASGAPADGGVPAGTCARSSCHNGTPTAQEGLITSNIPNTGYVPGQNYTTTATITEANKVKFGFQISPQNTAGAKLGTIVVTNSTETQTLGGGKYITHKTAGTGGTGSRTWTFDWTAPAAGTGAVTFYGSLMAANNNGSDSGDQVYNSTLTVQEAAGNNVSENMAGIVDAEVYPNPSNGSFNILVSNAKSAIKTNVFSAEGRLVYSNIYQNSAAKQIIPLATEGKLTAGIYFVSVETEGLQKVVKMIVQ